MRDFEIYERRAVEAEELAHLVSLPVNRLRYMAIATAWRELMDHARAEDAARPAQSA